MTGTILSSVAPEPLVGAVVNGERAIGTKLALRVLLDHAVRAGVDLAAVHREIAELVDGAALAGLLDRAASLQGVANTVERRCGGVALTAAHGLRVQ